MSVVGRLAVFGLALSAAPAMAAKGEGFDISGTVRLRYETIANQPRIGFRENDSLLNLRTTLLASYKSGPFSLVGELWDSRVYGDKANSAITTGEVNALELVQAYVGSKGDIGKTHVAGQAGRFLLNIGSRRLIAADEYRNTTNGYTGVKLDVAAPDGVAATLIYVLPQQRRPDSVAALRDNRVDVDHEGFDLVLWGGTASRARTVGPFATEFSFYHLGEHDRPGRPTRDRSLDTYGGRLFRAPAPGRIDGDVEAFRQSGSISASAASTAGRLSVSAWFAHASFGYTIPGNLKARLSLSYDYASGDKAGGHYGRFDTLFGMRRGELAPAGLYNAVGRANIETPGARVDIAPSPRWDAFVTYNPLWLAERTDAFSTTGVRDASGRSGSFAGHQIDSRIRWWARPNALRLEADATFLTKGRFLSEAPNHPAGGTTAYLSFNLTALF